MCNAGRLEFFNQYIDEQGIRKYPVAKQTVNQSPFLLDPLESGTVWARLGRHTSEQLGDVEGLSLFNEPSVRQEFLVVASNERAMTHSKQGFGPKGAHAPTRTQRHEAHN